MKRVISKSTTYYNLQGESWDEMKQYLQVRNIFGFWKTIDEETVPSYAWIAVGAFGSTDWKSKFRDIPNVKFIK